MIVFMYWQKSTSLHKKKAPIQTRDKSLFDQFNTIQYLLIQRSPLPSYSIISSDVTHGWTRTGKIIDICIFSFSITPF